MWREGIGVVRQTNLPWFVRAREFDRIILTGIVHGLNVWCLSCGAWGEYGVWTGELGKKLCPCCGGYNTEKVGDL